MYRTIASAATKSSTIDWMMRTTSIETSASCCMSGAPFSSEPQRKAAGRIAIGLARASRAIAMPSNPMNANVPGWKK